ncbi:MAG: SGNH/GDSL hydrolase family protein [Anaerolineae bacterium]|nr:MAG: SGNH/GDSL hydrolase family protein [Anaerolineae bacterium]
MSQTLKVLILLGSLICISGCGQFIAIGTSEVQLQENSQEDSATATLGVASTGTIAPTSALSQEETATPFPSATPDWTPTPDARLRPQVWRGWPIVPEISQHAVDIYLAGVAAGNDPHSFTVIGDCQSQPEVFFGIYATERYYFGIGYDYLQDAVDYFDGSFGRQSAAVEDGLSVASVFSPIWATHPECEGGESPLGCELRINNPNIAIVSLGTNWKPGAEGTFDELLRDLVDALLAEQVLPILVTKADNVEADNLLNQIMAQVAYDYDIPLWNFWRAVQHLPNQGLDTTSSDGLIYLAPEAWDVKSFTGLQTLDAFLRAAGVYEP